MASEEPLIPSKHSGFDSSLGRSNQSVLPVAAGSNFARGWLLSYHKSRRHTNGLEWIMRLALNAWTNRRPEEVIFQPYKTSGTLRALERGPS